MKTPSRSSCPFFLLVKDPSSHIESMQENKKFADDVSNAKTGKHADHKFAVSIPKGDSYYPVLRYKCVGDLRPVPIVSTAAAYER